MSPRAPPPGPMTPPPSQTSPRPSPTPASLSPFPVSRPPLLVRVPLRAPHRQLVKNGFYSYRSSIAPLDFVHIRSGHLCRISLLSPETSGRLRLPVAVCVQTPGSAGTVPIFHHEVQCLPWVFLSSAFAGATLSFFL